MMRSLLFAALGFAASILSASGDQVVPMESESYGVAFSKDGGSLAVFRKDKKLRVWDLKRGQFVQTFEPRAGEALSARLASSGQFATASTNGAVTVRDFATGQVTAAFEVPPTGGSGGVMTWTTDGAVLAVSGKELASPSSVLIRVIERAGKQRFQASAGIGGLSSMVFSPDGANVVATSLDTDIRVWDARTGALKRVIEEMKLAMFDLAFSPDGKYLATAGADRIIYLWDTKSWKVARKITGQPETIRRIQFSPDGTMLVTGGMNELNFDSPVQVILWDFATGRRLHAWTAEHMVQGLSFSPDGKWVAVADGTKNVKLLAVPNKRGTAKH